MNNSPFKKTCLIFTIALICNGYSNAQYNPLQPPRLPQAPNSATLGKFGDYEVSMFTGVPSISIPIYTIETKGFKIPITISYHASGIKLNEYPSWVGSGWALSAGGQINRRMNGWPDEIAFGFLTGEPRKAIDINPTDLNDNEYLKNLNEGQRDMGADLFSYSFPGHDGKFLFDRDNNYKPVTMPFAPINITNTGAMQPLNFDITDESGNKYEFGKTYTEQSLTSGGIQGTYISAFMLEKMKSAQYNDEVTFTYQAQFERSPLERTDSWMVEDLLDFQSTNWPHEQYQPSQGTFSSNYFGAETHSQCVKEILFNGGKVVFELDENIREDFNQTGLTNKALKFIKVYSKNNNTYVLVKTIQLYHSYFYDGYTNESKRLRLDKVEEIDNEGLNKKDYVFDYNNTTVLPGITPTMLSKDYWGYYNGRSNSCLIPQTQVEYKPYVGNPTTSTITIGTSNPIGREPDELFAQANILKKISYPTGGYTTFEYEGNKYLSPDNTVKSGGGLRIKAIRNYDGTSGTPLLKTYKYGVNESGSGRPNFSDDKEFFYEQQTVEKWACTDVNQTCSAGTLLVDKKRRRTFLGNSIIENEGMDGASVVYPVVTEYSGDNTGIVGKTIYEFRDVPDNLIYINYSSKPVVQTKYYSRGQPAKKTVYKKLSTGVFQPVIEETYQYNSTSFPNKPVNVGLSLKQWVVKETTQPIFQLPVYAGDWFHIDNFQISDDNYITGKTIKTYDQDDNSKFNLVTTSTTYNNFLHQQPSSITSVDSKGETTISEVRYPSDYIISNGLTNNTTLDAMIAKNMNAVPIEQWVRKQNGNKVTAGGLNLYKITSNNSIVLDKQKRLQIDKPISDYQPGLVSSGLFQADSRYVPMINFLSYNSFGDIQEIQKEKDVTETYLWGYNGEYPVAKIIGTNFSTASNYITQGLLDNPTDDASLRNHLNNLRSIPNTFVTTYTYNPLVGITSETDPRGRTTYYNYDAFNRLVLVRDHDGNILKKICYNYAGQLEDCSLSIPCVNTSPIWQNTGNFRCQVSSGNQFTGYTEYEQINTNTCINISPQWVVQGAANTAVCTPPGYGVSLTSTNTNGASGWVASYYNTTTGYTYNLNVSTATTLQALGNIPAGTYNLTIYRPGGGFASIFKSGCNKFTVSGTSVTFYNISVSSTSCNSITIMPDLQN